MAESRFIFRRLGLTSRTWTYRNGPTIRGRQVYLWLPRLTIHLTLVLKGRKS